MTTATESPVGPTIPDFAKSFNTLVSDSSLWLSTHYIELIVAIAIGVAIYVVLGIIKRYASRYVNKSESLTDYKLILIKAIARTSRFFRIMVSAELVVTFAYAPFSIDKVVHALFTISAILQTAIWLREIILGLFNRRLTTDPLENETLANAMALIRLFVTFILFAIATIMILDNLGVDVTGLVAGLGVGGIAIGLAAQGIFSDLFAALSIIFDKPFKRGETITYDTTTGTVEKIGLKSTRIRALTGEEIIISNTNLLDKEISNMTRLGRRRTRFGIGVIYQTQPDKARQIPGILREIVEKHGAEFIRAGFVGFGDSSINFEIDFDFMSDNFEVTFEGRHKIGLDIIQRFNDEGFEFAYPTQTTFTSAPDGKMIMPYPEGGFGIPAKEG